VALAVAVAVEVGDDDRVAVEVGELVAAGEAVEVAEAFGVGEGVGEGVEVLVEVGEGVEVVVGVGVLVVVEVGEGVVVVVVVGVAVEVVEAVGDDVVVVVVEVVEAVGDDVFVVVGVEVDRLPRVADVVYEAEGAARARELLRTASNPASENKSNVIESTPAKAHVAFSLLRIQKFNRRVLYEPASRLFFIFASFDKLDSNSQGRVILFRPATDCVLASPSRSER